MKKKKNIERVRQDAINHSRGFIWRIERQKGPVSARDKQDLRRYKRRLKGLEARTRVLLYIPRNQMDLWLRLSSALVSKAVRAHSSTSGWIEFDGEDLPQWQGWLKAMVKLGHRKTTATALFKRMAKGYEDGLAKRAKELDAGSTPR